MHGCIKMISYNIDLAAYGRALACSFYKAFDRGTCGIECRRERLVELRFTPNEANSPLALAGHYVDPVGSMDWHGLTSLQGHFTDQLWRPKCGLKQGKQDELPNFTCLTPILTSSNEQITSLPKKLSGVAPVMI